MLDAVSAQVSILSLMNVSFIHASSSEHCHALLISDSKTVQVDEKGEKVRSLVNSGMLILREIPENTPVEVRCIKFTVCIFFTCCEGHYKKSSLIIHCI